MFRVEGLGVRYEGLAISAWVRDPTDCFSQQYPPTFQQLVPQSWSLSFGVWASALQRPGCKKRYLVVSQNKGTPI